MVEEGDFIYQSIQGCFSTLGRMIGFMVVSVIVIVILLFIVVLLVRRMEKMRVKGNEQKEYFFEMLRRLKKNGKKPENKVFGK